MSIVFRKFFSTLQRGSCQLSKYCTLVEAQPEVKNFTPIISQATYINDDKIYQQKRQVWIDNLDTIEEKKLGLMTLHPEVFANRPRLDVLYQNIRWQKMYKYVDFRHAKNRAEMKGGGRKPWPQKGLGRARHGSVRSPLFKNGGACHGPRSPTTHFYMLPFWSRVNGLITALSVKLAQDDMRFVRDLEIPTHDPKYIESLIEERNWGPAVLFVDTDDQMPENITLATDTLKHVNLMPAYGLNVFSMLKHHTLVLTERAARHVEDKLLYHLNRTDYFKLGRKFKPSQA